MIEIIKALILKTADFCQQKNIKLAAAESCTGGGLSYWLTSVPGSSAWFERSFITYCNQAKKEMLGVKEETLARQGAVSQKTALEMAEGVLVHSHADVSLAITGIAGPDGGSEQKPVGTVWIALAHRGKTAQARHYLFTGDRQQIRLQSIAAALEMLLEQRE